MVLNLEKAREIASASGQNYRFLNASLGRNFSAKGVKPELVGEARNFQALSSGKNQELTVKEPPERFETPMFPLGLMEALNSALVDKLETPVNNSAASMASRIIRRDIRKGRRGY